MNFVWHNWFSWTPAAGCYALGYAIGLVAWIVMARRRKMATSGMAAIVAAALIGGLIGGHAAQWIAAGSDGKSVLGALAGGYIAAILYKRFLGIRRPTGDLFAVALSAGEAVGRWGCYFAGCCYGKPTHEPWAIWQHGAWRHPSQLYLSAANALILVVLLWCDRKRPPENTLFFLQGVLYCIARFTIEFFREGNAVALGLTAAQWACLAGLFFFSVKLQRLLYPARLAQAVGGA
ncbi:MAG: prolipoprotein diacylglyceryl transferase family protein [Capsulimonas sp.]|uniref:prolipoprotein diacylglyceryl transferase n=1 Tax=Capsulimonas sp. TaxID=2494211 RepID=UPI00326301FB